MTYIVEVYSSNFFVKRFSLDVEDIEIAMAIIQATYDDCPYVDCLTCEFDHCVTYTHIFESETYRITATTFVLLERGN